MYINEFVPPSSRFIIRRFPLSVYDKETLKKAHAVLVGINTDEPHSMESAIDFIKSLAQSPNITAITVVNVSIRFNDIVRTILSIKTITKVDLSRDRMDAENVQHLAALLETNTSVVDLRVFCFFLHAFEAKTFAKALAKNRTLRYFAYLSTTTPREHYEAFVLTMQTNTTLVSLEIGQNEPEPYVISSPTAKQVYTKLMLNDVLHKHPQYEPYRHSIPLIVAAREDIIDYCTMLDSGYDENSLVKLVVLGNGQIGKSTLVNTLKLCNEHKVKRALNLVLGETPATFTTSSTVGITQSSLELPKGIITIYDFAGQLEYTVTHQYFLSSELVVYLVCYDMREDSQSQIKQITYWLDFLHSFLGVAQSMGSWKVILVGMQSDLKSKDSLPSSLIPQWQQTWPKLPLYPDMFYSSKFDRCSAKLLLSVVKNECTLIMTTKKVPKICSGLLRILKEISAKKQHLIIHNSDLQAVCPRDSTLPLKYLHSVGSIVVVGDLICTDPTSISQMMAKFISPESVQLTLPHVMNKKVEILTSEQIGRVLMMKHDDPKLLDDLKFMSHFGICFPLPVSKNPSFMFPSLATKSEALLQFTIAPSPMFQYAGVRFATENGIIFVPGYYCRFIVEVFKQMNIADFVRIHSNGVVVKCPGLFHGEVVIMLESNSTSIVVLMMATNPSLQAIISVFDNLTSSFPQYTNCAHHLLCPTCIEEWIVKSTRKQDAVGTYAADQTQCSTAVHSIDLEVKPTSTTQSADKCWTHYQTTHDIFVNYRVATEGKTADHSLEPKRGMVQRVYESFANLRKQNGSPVFVFWDYKCLNFGQNWEKGFLTALTKSRVIVLLVSMKTLEGIAKNANVKQDNVLVEYECAILQNKLHKIPVLPVFLSEIEVINGTPTHIPFDFGKATSSLPHTVHIRNQFAQRTVDDMSATLASTEKKFLNTIYETMAEVFLLQGCFLPHRGENKVEFDNVITTVMAALERHGPSERL